MPEDAVTISSSSDTQAAVDAVAQGEEARRASEFQSTELPGISREPHSESTPSPVRAMTYEHPQSSRQHLLDALAEAENELSSGVVTNEPGEEAAAEPEPDNIDLEAVRQAATQDAIAEGRRRNAYYQEQANQHFSNPQAEIQALRAELLPAFQAKLQAQITPAEVEQLREGASIPLSHNPEVAARLLDCFVTLPGGVEASVYLMRNPAEVRQIAALPEHLAQARIVQLANRLDPSLQRKPSQAPAPIRPITGSPTNFQKSPDDMTYQEYRVFRDKQEKARYRR